MAATTSLTTLISPAKRLKDPLSYYEGVEFPGRWQVQNVLVFLRNSAKTLQQRNFANQLHHRFVLLVVLRTSGYLHLDGESLELVPGDGILIHPYQFHHYSDLQQPDLLWLFLTFETGTGQASLECLRHRVVRITATETGLLNDILHEYRGGPGHSMPEVLLPRMDCLLGELVRSTQAPAHRQPPRPHQGTTWFSSVEPQLRHGLDAGLNLGAIAARLGMSERSLRQRFKAEAGITLRDYRINHQLHRAVSLMRRPELPLKRIAELCGFQSAQSFSRFFRHTTGMSARDYRGQAASDRPARISPDSAKTGLT